MRSIRNAVCVGMLSLAAAACTSTGKDDKAEGGDSWLDKTEKNAEKEAKKLKEKSLPYYNSCKAEIDKFCKMDLKEPAKLGDCLKQNKDKLGPACKAAVEKSAKEHAK